MSGRMTLFSRWLGTMSIDVYWPFGISDSLRPRLSRREDVAPHIAKSLLARLERLRNPAHVPQRRADQSKFL